eukprot:m.60566 g.60566  ORF g.60566 m.60566 type:complete len:722 (+) comp11331_c0_seq2:81-2246(+)
MYFFAIITLLVLIVSAIASQQHQYVLSMYETAQRNRVTTEGAPTGFCSLPEGIEDWDLQTQCNGLPQFLSAFCKDHVQVVGDALVATVDDNVCQDSTHPDCETRQSGGVSIAGQDVFFGNISIVMKPARGDAIVTDFVAYDGANMGIQFNGGNTSKIGISIGNVYGLSADLDFDAADDYHRYDILWGNGTTDIYADGKNIFSFGNVTEVPTKPLGLYLFVYACGASYCGKFDNASLPTHAYIKAIAWTPEGTDAVTCSNPPPPPSYCDNGDYGIAAWLQNEETCNGTLVYKPDHTVMESSSITLKADHNVSVLSYKCRNATQAAGQVMGPSLIHFGNFTVEMISGNGYTNTRVAIEDVADLTAGTIAFEFQSAVNSVTLFANNKKSTIQLDFDPSAEKHTYQVAWSPNSISFIIDKKIVFTAAESIQTKLPVTVTLTPLKGSGTASLISSSYTPTGLTPTPCGEAPKFKLAWEDDFKGTTISEAWTVYDNCTHGNEAELYVPEGVIVDNGVLKLHAFKFAKNQTDQKGNVHQYGSGWVDTASNRSNQALNDCSSNNTHGYSMLYGKWEISAKMPPGHFWTAIWLMPDADICWPRGGEIDILESDIWGQKPPYAPHAAYHWSPSACFHNNGAGNAYNAPKGYNYSKAFHIYSAVVTPRLINYYVDGDLYFTITQAQTGDNLPKQPMYIILGNQLWQGWNYDEDLPADFEIDYVKAYTLETAP